MLAIGKEKCFCPSQGYSQLSTGKKKVSLYTEFTLSCLYTDQEELLFSPVKE